MDQYLGEYAVIREIGRGAMATVYQARDTRTGRIVALKVLTIPPSLPPEQRDQRVARFRREAGAIAHLSHRGIVTIHAVGEQDGQHFLVLEYLDGETLQARLDSRGAPLPLAEACPILAQVADALDAVHSHGLVHRDIKPSNIMLLSDGSVKLLDFGAARQREDTVLTQSGGLIGSPAYMSPEQVGGETGSLASDIWALGVLLYEILTGRAPFAGESIPSVLYQVMHKKPAPPPGVPVPVQKVILRALEKSPDRRYCSAREFADALQAAVTMPNALRRIRRRRWVTLALLSTILPSGAFVASQHFSPPEARPARSPGPEPTSREGVAIARRITPPLAGTSRLRADKPHEPIWRKPMILEITRRRGNTLAGTMTVESDEGKITFQVAGTVSSKTGRITLWSRPLPPSRTAQRKQQTGAAEQIRGPAVQ